MTEQTSTRAGLRLVSLIFAGVLTFAIPIDLARTIDSWAWEARRVRIVRSEIVRSDTGRRRSSSLRVDIHDLEDQKNIEHVRLGFGHQSPPTGPWSYLGGSTPADYPVGKEIVAYRNPANHDQFILQQRGVSWLLLAIFAVSVSWTGWNIIRFIRNRPAKSVPAGAK